LGKLWGDVDSDSTLDPETDPEAHKLSLKIPDASKYLVSSQSTMKKGKRARPRKQRSPTYKLNTQVHDPPEHSKVVVYTRSKPGSNTQNNLNLTQ
jgi:hypothetical protein